MNILEARGHVAEVMMNISMEWLGPGEELRLEQTGFDTQIERKFASVSFWFEPWF
jgi:hypothetical protein